MIGRVFLIFAALTCFLQVAKLEIRPSFPEHFNGIQQLFKHLNQQKVDRNDVSEEVKQILNNLESKINKITNDVPQSLKWLDEVVRKVLKNMDLNKFVEDMEAKIEDIFKKAEIEASTVQNCIDIEKDQVNILINDASVNIKKCVSKVDDSTRIIKDNALELQTRANTLLEKMNNDFKQCTENVDCMQNLLDSMKDKVHETIKEIEVFIVKATHTIHQLGFDIKKCMVSLEMDVWDQKRLIITEFKKCIIQ